MRFIGFFIFDQKDILDLYFYAIILLGKEQKI